MINIEHQQKIFLVKWASKLLQRRNETWVIIARKLFTPLGGHICALNANVNENKVKGLKTIKSEVWKTELIIMTTVNTTRKIENTRTEPL